MLPLKFEELPHKIKEILEKDSSNINKLKLAKGLIPLLPKDYLMGLYFLLSDDNDKIRTTAHQSLKEFPLSTLSGLLEMSNLPFIIDFFTNYILEESKLTANPIPYEKVELLKKIALNQHTFNETFLTLSRFTDNEEIIDIIVGNQKRLMECPEIYYALKENRFVKKNLIDRLSFFMKVTMKVTEDISEEEFSDIPINEVVQIIDNVSEMMEKDLPQEIINSCIKDTQKEEFTKEEEKALASKISELTFPQKLYLALRGNREARAILIKSPSIIIKRCVLINPKLTLMEVSEIARDKFQDSRVIRIIASNREWTKYYTVRFNLCCNPKVPFEYGIKFLSHISKKDLMKIAHSKDISANMASAAKSIIEKG